MTANNLPTGKGRYARRQGPRRRFKSVLVTFPPSLVPALDEAATILHFDNRSALVRTACAEFLQRNGLPEEGHAK